ncbi:SDR family NAD(P)-dependent oxidoreductase, partial [Klebsiella aerogenes]|uniref:SDR family NAD(P)-dependent oxidoreductase n=2 Tax=Enterobacterales TaxID=91347 RepID=UPI000E2ED84D
AVGHRVVGTVRNSEALQVFAALDTQRAFGYLLDVTDDERIDEVVGEIESAIGPIDVLVNNAGYGHEGILE